MQKKFKSLDILKYESSKEYFADLLVFNKKINPKYTNRFLAQKLKWPASYISDLIKSRKPLTIKRALEFSDHFHFSNIETEKLIWIALSETGSPEARLHYKKKLTKKASEALLPTVKTENLENYNTLCEVLTILQWSHKKLTAEEIKANFDIAGFELESIKKALQFIEKNNLITWDQQGQLIKKTKIVATDNFDKNDAQPYVGIDLHRAYAKNFLAFIDHPKAPATYNSGFVEIKKSQFMPLALKIIELRNWLLETSASNQESIHQPDEPTHLMQFNFDLFRLNRFKKEKT